MSKLTISGMELTVNRKDIKNLHISVLPPDGMVRVSVPLKMSEQAIRLAVISKLAWIKKQKAEFASQLRQSDREMLYGESHYLWGHRYLLDIEFSQGKHSVVKASSKKLLLTVSEKTTHDKRLKLLNDFYRQEVKDHTEQLLEKWQRRLGVEALDWGVKKMKTKWGSCNISSKRIWLNSELAKKPPECLEYILLHELVHLLERHHNERFKALMDKHLPDWRERRDLLNRLPLAHDSWEY
ncbi:SprT family zinc-dependent metalloprotease [Vibrio sp. CAU 1672]|uniref:M48 family metallopeptidase n=1 Tax=Vibrio sp. CAU 1672 TaxID=3032594 RepID=UPI0023DC01C2|nr:SprT family zinc-dependent metalloprotease [Vibrio sp. CAU 1672]MDF2155005.1 SprT family zinc-dependent metalloprotease [Vibrio sp. CAU 1672]